MIMFRSTTFYKNERKITVCKAHDRVRMLSDLEGGAMVVSLKKHQRQISVLNENSSLECESADRTN